MPKKAYPTIHDIALIAGVTPGTVSRALNDSSLVNENTKKLILKIADDVNYSPNMAARRLSIGKTFAIGVIVPFFTRPSVSERLSGVVSVLSNSPYDLVIFDIENPKQRTIGFQDMLRKSRIDGALIVSMPILDEDIEYLHESQIPIVFIDRKHPGLEEFDSIMIDDILGGYQATKHLIDLGHRKIGFIGDITEVQTKPKNGNIKVHNPFRFTSSKDRYEGYLKALAEAGILPLSIYFGEDHHGHIEAKAMALKMLTLPDPPTAIFAASDTQAFGVIQAAKELGRSIPADLSVVGFDDVQAAEFMELTTIRQMLYRSGQLGVKSLIKRIDDPDSDTHQIYIPTEIIKRKTTAIPNGRAKIADRK
jgi:LacI family transcriptional regulator